MITLFFISLIAFIAGITAVTLKYSIPASISESYYLLPPKARIPIFYGWTVLVALPLAVFWLDISGGTAQTLVFFGCVFLIGVGVAAPFKEEHTQIAHFICAGLCVLFTQLWIFIYTPFWVFTLALTGLFATFGYRTQGASGDEETSNSLTFFLELAVFLSVYISVYGFYKLLNY
ncbi:hypothetical protein EZS27_005857 [termite gut metagenome]|uniref:Uncharacterized protein n=1 Tax=termite gut metagenome TaxID=433724 RepID=A0A5J4SLC5_9ZZZZ